MPLLTTQSAKSFGLNSFTSILGDYVSIGSYTVTGSPAANIEFTNISQNYDHLQFFYTVRTSASSNTDFVHVNFNNDATANYNFDYLESNTGTTGLIPGIGQKSTNNNAWLTKVVGNTSTANVFAVGQGVIADYSKNNRNKTMHCFGGYDDNGLATPVGNTRIETSVWFSLNPITSIKFTTDSGQTFAVNTNISLFGIKGTL